MSNPSRTASAAISTAVGATPAVIATPAAVNDAGRSSANSASSSSAAQSAAGSGSVNFASTVNNAVVAPVNYAVLGSYRSGSVLSALPVSLNSGSTKIFVDADGRLAVFSDAGLSGYARGSASVVDQGSVKVKDTGTDVEVKWGIYAGGSITQSSGSIRPDYFQYIGGLSTPPAVQATLSATYNNVIGQSKLITEAGKLGGEVTKALIRIDNGKLTTYSIGVSDAASRAWSASCPSCAAGVSLSTFASSGVALSGTGPGAGVTGKSYGIPVGATAKALISSFALGTLDGKAVTGSFVAK